MWGGHPWLPRRRWSMLPGGDHIASQRWKGRRSRLGKVLRPLDLPGRDSLGCRQFISRESVDNGKKRVGPGAVPLEGFPA